jgi:hypothetical protein
MAELGLAASHREIGATVARLFEDVRRETKRTIEAKLGRASMAMPIQSVTGTGETPTGRRAGAPASARLALGVVAVVGLIAVVAIAAWRRGAASPPAQSVAPAAAPAPIAAPVPAAAPAKHEATVTPTSPDAIAPRNEAATPTPRPSRPAAGGAARATAKRPPPTDLAAPEPPAAIPTPAAGGAPAPAHDCAHPFYVDADGIKRFRPECM